jgi:thiamine-phosphate pyrophosphorylase
MNSSPIMRIMDANLNRLAEGLRVLEEVTRMILDDAVLTEQLKTLRHDLIRGDLPFNTVLLRSRNSADDVGASLEVAGQNQQEYLELLVVSNSRRAQESLRVLEEIAKLPEIMSVLESEKFKKARFELYTLEQKIVENLMRKDKIEKVKGLYVILDTGVLKGLSHIEAARQIIQAGVKVIQLRDKTPKIKSLLAVAREIQALCKQNDVLFIMNDHLDIALAADVDGLHIGQDDLPAEVARRLLPRDKILGVSAATAEQAVAAEDAGADYIGVGCIYPTSSKDDVELVGVDRVRQIKMAVKIPVAAIGGINGSNIHEVIEAGADSVCVIRAVLDKPDIARAARELIDSIGGKNEKINGKPG